MTTLVEDIQRNNAPAVAGKLPIDISWFVEGRPVMFDLKTIPDFVASYVDGRIHSQIKSMQAANCFFFGFMLIGDPISFDGGVMAADTAWTWNGLDDAILDVEVFAGAKIMRAPSKERLAHRIAGLWNWTGKDEFSGWQAPISIHAENNFKEDIVFFDETFRGQVGAMMHWPGFGLKNAKNARDAMTFMEAWGITEEGLVASTERLRQIKGIGPKMLAAREAWIRA